MKQRKAGVVSQERLVQGGDFHDVRIGLDRLATLLLHFWVAASGMSAFPA